MGRPEIPPGTAGQFSKARKRGNSFQVRATYRDNSGQYLYPSATGPTPAAAWTALNVKISKMIDVDRDAEITPDTRVHEVAALWLAEMERKAEGGDLAQNTVRNYRTWWTNHLKKPLGDLRMRQLTGVKCNNTLKTINDVKSYATAKGAKSVLVGICQFGVRYDALSKNPVAAAEDLVKRDKDRKKIVALDYEERVDLLAKLEEHVAKKTTDVRGRKIAKRLLVWRDLPDLVRLMLSTGVRVGELLALLGRSFYRDKQGRPIVVIDAHIIRVKGVGLVREEYRKNSKDILVLQVPEWSVPIYARRSLAAGTEGALFASALGGYLDPSNSISRIRSAFEQVEYGWVNSHVFRKTVSDLLDAAGLSNNHISDQLGITPAVVEKHYRRRQIKNAANVAVLETMFDEPPRSDERANLTHL